MKATSHGQLESFENLFQHLSHLAISNQNKQRPLPTNNFPKIPRRSKNKRTSSKYFYPDNKSKSSKTVCGINLQENASRQKPNDKKSNTANFNRDMNPMQNSVKQTSSTAKTKTNNDAQLKQSFVENPVIIVSRHPERQTETLLKKSDSKLDLESFVKEKCDGDLNNLGKPQINAFEAILMVFVKHI